MTEHSFNIGDIDGIYSTINASTCKPIDASLSCKNTTNNNTQRLYLISSLLYTFAIHSVLLSLLFVTLKLPTDIAKPVKVKVLPINAKLFYKRPPEVQSTESKKRDVRTEDMAKAKKAVPELQYDDAVKTYPRKSTIVTSADKPIDIKPKSPSVNRLDRTKKNAFPKSSLASSSLTTLRKSLYANGMDKGAIVHYNKQVNTRNSIEKSNTKYLPQGQVAEIKVKIKRVDCKSGINKSISTLSGLLGGTIMCNKRHDLTKFIKQRVK